MAAILNFMVKKRSKVKINAGNGFFMPKLVRNDPLFVKIAPHIQISNLSESDIGHFEKRRFSGLSPKN